MTDKAVWPPRIAAIVAVAVGGLLVIGGTGHLTAVLQSRAGQPFDYRFVSLLTTSGILIFPGVVALGSSYWLWHARPWAFVSSLLSASALALYLVLLLYMQTQVADSAVGSELYFMTGAVAILITSMAGTLLCLRQSRPSTARTDGTASH